MPLESKTEILGHVERPDVVVCTNQNRGILAEVAIGKIVDKSNIELDVLLRKNVLDI